MIGLPQNDGRAIYTYKEKGLFKAILRITDEKGNVALESKTINVFSSTFMAPLQGDGEYDPWDETGI
ncbi:MAG: PKD domain-containing protein, partial [Candidatus Methanofastidiosia archaeon]